MAQASCVLRGVIFDLDGVLIDSHPAHEEAWRELLRSVGHLVSDEALKFILDGRKKNEILCHFLGPLSDEQVHELSVRKDELFREAASDIKLVKGVAAFLDELEMAGIPKGVATSAGVLRTNELLERFHLKYRFQCVVTGDDVFKGKPDPQLFQLASESLDAKSERLLVIEDAVSGIKAAKAAGTKCVGLATSIVPALLYEAGADAVATDFCEITLSQVRSLFIPGAHGVSKGKHVFDSRPAFL